MFLITEVFLIKSDDQAACFSDSKTTVSFIEVAIAGASYITRYYTTAKFNHTNYIFASSLARVHIIIIRAWYIVSVALW